MCSLEELHGGNAAAYIVARFLGQRNQRAKVGLQVLLTRYLQQPGRQNNIFI